MRRDPSRLAPLILLATLAPLRAPSAAPTASPADWRTPAEAGDYRTTPDYDHTLAFVRRLVAAAPRQARLEVFGRSGEGRDLVAVVVSGDGRFDPAALHRTGRPVVMIQNAIHAGEMDGKDACLALLRDVLVAKTARDLVSRAVLVVIPIYNADGHERIGAFNRINQNGPERCGWRTQARNLNLNRDYMKADAPETRALLALFRRWRPDLFVDDHVTDGADYQYDVTYALDLGSNAPPGLAAWERETLAPELERRVTAAGHLIAPYISLKDDTDVTRGLTIGPDPPRFSTGYMILQDRPGMLVEMHMLKDYRTRVTGNDAILRALLAVVNRDAATLTSLTRAADAATVAAGKRSDPGARFPLAMEADGTTEPFTFLGYRSSTRPSPISGAPVVEYTRDPVTLTVPRQTRLRVTRAVAPPRAYIVPAQWTEVIGVLEAHGLALRRTTRPYSAAVDTYRCEGGRWLGRPFEGRQVLFWPGGEGLPAASAGVGPCRPVRETLDFPAGSAVVPLDQRGAKVAIHWLEPEGPDSAVAWGFFNAIFEQKEYGEAYVVEPMARDMLAKDPALKEEFEKRLAGDPEFAASPAARLDFFYRRSPYWDRRLALYPVGRLGSLDGLPLAR